MVSYALDEKRKDITLGKVKYSEEMKEQTIKYVLEGGKSATKVSKELGIDTNTVCRRVESIGKVMKCPHMKLKEE